MTTGSRRWSVTILGGVLAFAMLARNLPAQSVPLSSSVLIYDRKSLEAAPAVVERIAAIGDKRIMFVVTIQCRLTAELRPYELGLMKYRYDSWADRDNYEPLDEPLLAEYRNLLKAAFAAAANAGMDIAILPHFDPAGEVSEWRNLYDFDPLEEYQGFSYESVLIDSCIDALLKTTDKKTPIHFSLSGEMGRSAFAHADSYRKLTAKLRRKLAGRPLSVGISFNHNGVAGEYIPNETERDEMRQFVEELDFIGFSEYTPFELPPTANQFSTDCDRFLAVMEKFGAPIPKETPLHFSEIGLGGAPGKWGISSPERAAAEPWKGNVNPQRNPWRVDTMIDLRRAYFDALLEFLRTQPGPRHVEAAYLWSEGSWEPLGIHKRVFRDETITSKISGHNQKACKRLEAE